MKIAVYTVAKDEETRADAWYRSVSSADLVLVGDTGSSDGTAQLLTSAGAQVLPLHVDPWRFDTARNAVLAALPTDVDVCVCCDLDELLEPGWRSQLEQSWLSGTTACDITYVTEHDASGAAVRSHFATRVHARRGHVWQGRAESQLLMSTHQQITRCAGMVMHHHRSTRDRSYYLDLLAKDCMDWPNDPDRAYRHAAELGMRNQRDDAVAAFVTYLQMPSNGRSEERSEAMIWLSRLQPHEWRKWLLSAVAEAPDRRETWFNLSCMHVSLGEWEHALSTGLQAAAISTPYHSPHDDPRAWGAQLPDNLGLAYYNLGFMSQAHDWFERAEQLQPNDQRIRGNLLSTKIQLGRIS
jgi:glycosyltransferase involved in cell wall biosynthesis